MDAVNRKLILYIDFSAPRFGDGIADIGVSARQSLVMGQGDLGGITRQGIALPVQHPRP